MKERHSGHSGASHSEQILEHLRGGNKLTPLEALELFGCFSLSQRVTDLRKKGHKIITTMITTNSGKRIAEYHLES